MWLLVAALDDDDDDSLWIPPPPPLEAFGLAVLDFVVPVAASSEDELDGLQLWVL